MTIADYRHNSGKWVLKSKRSGRVVHTISGLRWVGVKVRCSSYHQKTHQCYIGTENNFTSFECFVDWCRSEQGYEEIDHLGSKFALDKDILLGHGKKYSEDRCILVPRCANNLLPNIGGRVGLHPLGVCINTNNGLFQAQCNDTFSSKKLNLGYYSEAMDAHAAYQRRKIVAIEQVIAAYSWHKKLVDGLDRMHSIFYDDFMASRETKQAL